MFLAAGSLTNSESDFMVTTFAEAQTFAVVFCWGLVLSIQTAMSLYSQLSAGLKQLAELLLTALDLAIIQPGNGLSLSC